MQRVLTGIRPTGPLHLGHYVGALKQWVDLQDTHECYFMIADVQALTTHAKTPGLIERAVREVMLDFLAVGIDPARPNVNIILQSGIRELPELTVYLSMVTPFAWMKHNPTVRAEQKSLRGEVSTGFMYYVVSQAADILFVSPDPAVDSHNTILVPVGEDQAPHLRDTNRIAGKFNKTYGPVFVTCEPLIGDVGRLVGTDGQEKMSKSLGNAIDLGENPEELRRKVMRMFTDPTRLRSTDPGHTENNPVFIYLEAFDPDTEGLETLKGRYREGKVGDVEVKHRLLTVLDELLTPIRERRAAADKMDLHDILRVGTANACRLAAETMERVRSRMHLDYDHLGG